MGRASMGIFAAADGGGGEGAGALHERISALENLLYQSMEAQTAAEDRCVRVCLCDLSFYGGSDSG